MLTLMFAKELFAAANERVGRELFKLDEEGVCRLMVGGDLVVTIMPFEETGDLLVSAKLGEEPVEGRETFYRTLLRAMYMFEHTAGATFSLDDETGEILFVRQDPLAVLDAETFLARLKAFGVLAREWRLRLLEFRPALVQAENARARKNAARGVPSGEGDFIRV